ncbi:WD40/YVTN/BNR-like repeat-containing protein [Thermus neutrinimicus]|uniref:WD40/YVTN/BNR-like repeat-containing protein n=1 Tax=Thermus neutrinimicus TaxID=2908149 RepID=UPI001FA9CD3F|nr:S-layer protein [Thermus neutrinimicus]
MRPLTLTLFLGLALAQTPLGPVPTRDVHALLWHPSGVLLLGHHDGIVAWTNGAPRDLVRRRDWDAMNLAWDGRRLIVAGHWVLAESRDLQRFRDLRPKGLPALDLHAYAIDPRKPEVHYALEATYGYFRSQDGGQTWARLTARGLPKVGMAFFLVDLKGRLWASLLERRLFLSEDGGKSFRPIPAPDPVPGPLALSPSGVLYLGGKLGLWQQTERGWRRLWQGTVLALAAHPQEEGLLAWVDARGTLWRGR